MEAKVCKNCGQPMPESRGRQTVCEECRKETARKARKAYAARQAGLERPCAKCGLPFSSSRRNILCKACRTGEGRCTRCGQAIPDSRKLYCDACREIAKKEAMARATAKWRKTRSRMDDFTNSSRQNQMMRDRMTLEEYGTGAKNGTYKRGDGVTVLPAYTEVKKEPRPPRKPNKAKEGSLEDVLYKLDLLNYQRRKAGLAPISYGKFVAENYAEQEIERQMEAERLKKAEKARKKAEKQNKANEELTE